MKILFQSPHSSIDKLNPVDVPDFVVLTGVNGSGKTHFLQAIKNKNLIIEGHGEDRIVYFDYFSFFLEDEGNYTSNQVNEERKSAWNLFITRLKTVFESHWNSYLRDGDLGAKILEKCKQTGISVWSLTTKDFDVSDDFNRLKRYRTEIDKFFETNQEFKDNNQAKSIHILAEHLPYFLNNISEEDFLNLYTPISLKQDFLPMQLGKIFFDYYVKWLNNETRISNNNKFNRSDPVLTEIEFEKLHGPKPWQIVDSILKRFNTLDFEINTPEGLDYFTPFHLRLTNTKNGADVSFSSLSSGEKVLMALVASIYKLSSDSHFPGILLLDEIDASLHPSMIKNMLDVINDVFVKNGTKVVIVTHSPTTIALTSEESVYVMNKQGEGENRIEKSTQSNALSILTEGYATLDEGLTLLDQTAKKEITIFTEGNNILYLEKAIHLLSEKNKEKIEIIDTIKDITGKDNLYQFYRLFSKISHTSKVLFVWDCDFDKKPEEKNNTFAHIFANNSANTKVKNGIENLFSEDKFADKYYDRTPKIDGGCHIDLNKSRFAEEILKTAMVDDFVNFQPFIDKINGLLKK